MLVSHRRHAPIAGICIELDRLLAPSWIARRVRLAGVVQDESLTAGLGKGTASERVRLDVVLRGRLEATVGGRSFVIGPGDFLLVPRLAACVTRGDGDNEILELDWDPGAPVAANTVSDIEHGTLSSTARAGARALGSALAQVDGRTLHATAPIVADAFRALAADGLPVDPRAAEGVAAGGSASDQALFDAIDAALANLEASPAVVGLEQQLGWARRTVSRRASELHQRYGIQGLDGESWRSVRDFYRVLIGTIFASSPDITTRGLATILGYTSPDALCHAFANAGLPSPGAVKKLRRAA